jgi:hypothetical protein
MYVSYYLLYKYINGVISNVEAIKFGTPQEENTYTAKKRKEGYRTQRIDHHMWSLITAGPIERVSIG